MNTNTNSKRIITLLLLLFSIVELYAQQESIKGKIVDKLNMPIEFATVLLEAQDRSYQSVLFTDSAGCFAFDRNYDKNYLLVVQHISYKTDSLTIGMQKHVPYPLVLAEKKYSV